MLLQLYAIILCLAVIFYVEGFRDGSTNIKQTRCSKSMQGKEGAGARD